jgi:hypothetical protein
MEKIRSLLVDSAKKRRKRKTPNALKKTREGGQGKVFTYVDRPQYQIWLDENFPGWTTSDLKHWTERAEFATGDNSQNTPVLFCVSFTLRVSEHGVRRDIPCIGTAAVSSKELSRDNAQLLKEKYKAALTEAYKTGCGWLGAFFDLRADDDERENAYKEVTNEQVARYDALKKRIPLDAIPQVEAMWRKQNGVSADEFLFNLTRKVESHEAQEREKKAKEVKNEHVG